MVYVFDGIVLAYDNQHGGYSYKSNAGANNIGGLLHPYGGKIYAVCFDANVRMPGKTDMPADKEAAFWKGLAK